MLKEKIKRRVKILIFCGLIALCLNFVFGYAANEIAGNGAEHIAYAEPPSGNVDMTPAEENMTPASPADLEGPQQSGTNTDPPPQATPPAGGGGGGAAAGATTDPVSAAAEDTVAALIDVISFILKALNRIFWPIILVMGGLFDNSLLFGWGMEEKLLDIWRQIRNLVNVIFVVMLLGIALANVIGVGGENYYLKTILPKFIIGLIAVNFSFLIMKVMLDALNVATTAMFSLPTTLDASPIPMSEGIDKRAVYFDDICKSMCGSDGAGCEISGETFNKIQGGTTPAPLCYAIKEGGCMSVKIGTGDNNEKKYANSKKLCPSQKLVDTFVHFNGQNASIILAVRMMNMAKLDHMDNVGGILKAKNGWEKLTVSIIFSLIMYIIYGTGFVVLFIVLIVRLVVLWLAIALSPIIVLKYVFPQILEKLGGGDLEQKVVQTALAPLIIAFTMSVGFIMMDKFSAVTGNIGGVLGNTALSGKGGLIESAINLDMGTPGISTIQQLFMAAATTAFVWMGIVAASSKSVAEKLTGTITGAVGKAGGWLAFAPFKYTGLIPVKGEKGQEMASLGTMLKAIESIPASAEQQTRDQMQRLFPQLTGDSANMLAKDIGNATSPEDLKKIMQRPSFQSNITDPAVVKALRASSHTRKADEKIHIAVQAAKDDGTGVDEGNLRAAHADFLKANPPAEETPAAGAQAKPKDLKTQKNEALAEIKALKDRGITVEAKVKDNLNKATTDPGIQKALDESRTAIDAAKEAAEKNMPTSGQIASIAPSINLANQGQTTQILQNEYQSRYDVLVNEQKKTPEEAKKKVIEEITKATEASGIDTAKKAAIKEAAKTITFKNPAAPVPPPPVP